MTGPPNRACPADGSDEGRAPTDELTCAEFVELVTAYLDRTLDAGTERRFLDHLQLCDGCETYLDQFRQTIDTLGHLPAESLPTDIRDAVIDAFRAWPDEPPAPPDA
jgi:anti-sigma factor RsiW